MSGFCKLIARLKSDESAQREKREDCDAASYIPSKQGIQAAARGSIWLQQDDKASVGAMQCRGTGCNLQDVRSNDDMQADKHNTKTAWEG